MVLSERLEVGAGRSQEQLSSSSFLSVSFSSLVATSLLWVGSRPSLSTSLSGTRGESGAPRGGSPQEVTLVEF